MGKEIYSSVEIPVEKRPEDDREGDGGANQLPLASGGEIRRGGESTCKGKKFDPVQQGKMVSVTMHKAGGLVIEWVVLTGLTGMFLWSG